MPHHKPMSKAKRVSDSTVKSTAAPCARKPKPASATDHVSDANGAAPGVSPAGNSALSNGQSIDALAPNDHQVTLLGEPLLLTGESKLDYEAFLADVSAAVKPRNILEQVWVRDFVDHEWSVLRLRRHAAAVVNASKTSALAAVLRPLLPNEDALQRERLASHFTLGDEAAIKKVEGVLEKAGLNYEAVLAEGTASRIEAIERLDRMAVNAQKWRDAAVREIDRRRLGIGMIERFTTQELEDEGYRVIQIWPRIQKAA